VWIAVLLRRSNHYVRGRVTGTLAAMVRRLTALPWAQDAYFYP